MNAALRERILAYNRRVADGTRAKIELAELRMKFEILKSTASWVEMDTRAQIATGTRVRYFLKTYECTQAHEKSVLRAPTNGAYWKEADE